MRRLKVEIVASVFALLTLIPLSACRRELCPEAARVAENFDGECLGKVAVDTGRVDITPHPLCTWHRLIDLSIFDGFWPGMTTSQARELLGAPDAKEETDYKLVWRYNRPKGVVQISHEDQGSGFIPMYWWILRAHPKDGALATIFPPAVVAHFSPTQEPHEITVLNQCGLPMVTAIVDKGQVKELTWIDNPGSYPSRQGAEE